MGPGTAAKPLRPSVRPARPNDWAKLAAFITEAWRESGPGGLGFAGAKDESVSEIASESFLRRRLSSPAVLMVVAEVGRSITGLATVRRLGQREAEVVGIATLKGEDSRETEARLLRKSLEVARKRGYSSVVAQAAHNDEKAARFYVEAGFVESGRAPALASRRPPMRVYRRGLR